MVTQSTTLTIKASAVDVSGNRADAIPVQNITLLPASQSPPPVDPPPTISIASPRSPSVFIESQTYSLQVDTRDNIGVEAVVTAPPEGF